MGTHPFAAPRRDAAYERAQAAEAVSRFTFGVSNDVAALGLGWWTWFFPGLVLVLILVCVNLVGDALDAALDPAATRA